MRTVFAVLLAVGCLTLAASANPPTTGGIIAPAYGAYYSQPAGFTQAEAKRVVELLESIDARMARLESAVFEPAEPSPTIQAVASDRCSSCHTPSAAEKKGGGFTLFTGDEAKALRFLSTRELNRVKEAVQSGAMPPGDKLSPAEKSAFSKE